MTTRDNEVQLPRAAALQTTESIRAARQRAQEQADATLREQANLLNLTHDSIFVRDMGGSVIKYWNRAAEELYGWHAEHAIGKVAHELLKTVFPAPLDEIQAELLAAGRWEGELLHTTRDGAQVAVASRWSLQRDDHGAPVAILETNNDITERKRAEEARRHSEEQWRAAFECNPTMYFILDAAGTIASVNLFGAQQLGYTVGELIGQSVLMVFHPADREFIQRQAAACFDEPGRMRQWEAHKIRKDGTMLWVRETANSVVLRNQQVLLVVCEDITEQKRAEDAARQSERELRDVIESIPAMVWTARPDGSNSFVNKRWEEYTGVTFEQTSGSGWVPVLHPDDIHGYVDAWLRSVEHGERFEHEVRFRRAADGEYRWFRSQGVPLRDEQGRIVKWFGVVTDVEDRKRAEALLAGEKRILEMVAKGDSLGEILDSLCRLVEEQEASGVLASILLLDGDQLWHGGAPSLPEAYTAAIDGVRIGPSVGSCGTAAYLARQVIVEDIATDPLWADYRTAALPHSLRACWSTPIFSSASKVIATFAMYYRQPRRPTARDHEIIEQITHLAGVAIERKLTYDELQRSRTYLAEAQRLTHTGSWALRTSSNTISYWSEENFRVWGFEPQQGLPTSDIVWDRIHPDDLDRMREAWKRAQHERRDYSDEYRIVLPEGSIRHIYLLSHPVCNASGEIVEHVGTHVDVTERKRAEAERERLRQLEADLARVNRVTTMGELTASLAHEVNQPIAAAITDANTCLRWLTREQPDLQEAREAARRTVKDTTRAADIISRMRALFRKSEPEHELVHVRELITEIVTLVRPEAIRQGVSIETELAPDLPIVSGDRVQLQQVLLNLIMNAIEATKDVSGPRESRVSARRGNADQLLVSVSDTGVGLPDNADEIFKAFVTTKADGTGMGLAISRSIIESHGGRLWAESNDGPGATFCFRLAETAAGHA